MASYSRGACRAQNRVGGVTAGSMKKKPTVRIRLGPTKNCVFDASLCQKFVQTDLLIPEK